jgi:hypothetical protein
MTSSHIAATGTLDTIVAFDTIASFVVPCCPADVIEGDVA